MGFSRLNLKSWLSHSPRGSLPLLLKFLACLHGRQRNATEDANTVYRRTTFVYWSYPRKGSLTLSTVTREGLPCCVANCVKYTNDYNDSVISHFA